MLKRLRPCKQSTVFQQREGISGCKFPRVQTGIEFPTRAAFLKVSVENDVPARYAVRVPVHLSRKQGGTASFSSLSGDEFFLPCKCQKGPADLYLVVKRRKL